MLANENERIMNPVINGELTANIRAKNFQNNDKLKGAKGQMKQTTNNTFHGKNSISKPVPYINHNTSTQINAPLIEITKPKPMHHLGKPHQNHTTFLIYLNLWPVSTMLSPLFLLTHHYPQTPPDSMQLSLLLYRKESTMSQMTFT